MVNTRKFQYQTSLPRRKKRRQAKNNIDRAWRLQSKPRKANAHSIVNLRVKRPQPEIPYKTSVIFNITQMEVKPAQEVLSAHLAKIPNYRPAEQITDFSLLGSPLAIKTPGGSKLMRSKSYGAMYFFEEHLSHPQDQSVKTLDAKIKENFKNSAAYLAIKEIQDTVKLQTTTLTSKELNQRQGPRKISQNQVMARTAKSSRIASAQNYANSTTLFDQTLKWEWLHLVAYMILGEKAQQSENLVAGTTHANTDMLLIETLLPVLAERYPQGFDLTVQAKLLPGTQIAHEIAYTIKTDHFTLPLVFNAQSRQQPHLDYFHYLKTYVEQLIAATGEEATIASSPIKLPLFRK